MFIRNMKLAFRANMKYKTVFLVNLFGLSVGLVCSLLIYLWVRDEMSFDKFHENDSRLFQVMRNYDDRQNIYTMPQTPGVLAETLVSEFAEVEKSVPVIDWFPQTAIVAVDDKLIRAKELYAGKDFFSIFSYHLVKGEKNKVLTDKADVVISDDLAKRLFNSTDVIGKSIEWKRLGFNGAYRVSGVFEKLPTHSTENFDLVFAYDLFYDKYQWIGEWKNGGPLTYVLLKEGVDVNVFNDKIENLIQKKSLDTISVMFARQYSSKYLYNRFVNGVQAGGRIEYVNLLSLIAVFVLVIACINFMNLSTAKSTTRSKEVGLRKTLGASRRSLIWQYMSEAMIVTFSALIVSLVAVYFFLPKFNEITGKQIEFVFGPSDVLIILGITLITAVISGSYPALYLSALTPVGAIKGKASDKNGVSWFRSGLVTFQFALSVLLVFSVVVVYLQLNMVQTRNLGYDKSDVVYFNTEYITDAFMDELRAVPGVENASTFYHDLAGRYSSMEIDWETKPPQAVINFAQIQAGYGFVETAGIDVLEGTPFSRERGSEKQVILNETAVKLMQLPDPVGKVVKVWDADWTIVGIVKDFHFESLYSEVKPCFIQLTPIFPAATKVMVRLRDGDEAKTIEGINDLFHRYNAGLAFEYKFLEDDLAVVYAGEIRVSRLSWYFAGIAITISCLGLLGLANFSAERRRKEISIRKVLGSTEQQIILLLMKEFTRTVIIGAAIGLGISYWIARRWLDGFALRIGLDWWLFLLVFLFTILLTWLTIFVTTIRAARIGAVINLRAE